MSLLRNPLIVFLVICFSVGALSADAPDRAQAADEQYAKGNALVQQGKFKEAIVEYQKVLSDFSNEREFCAKAQFQIAKAYYELKDVKNAHYAFLKVTKDYESFPVIAASAQIHRGDMYQKEMMYPAAVAAYKDLVSKYHDQTNLCIAALNGIAKTQRTRGKIAEALEALQRIVDEFAVSSRAVSDAMFARADICYENGYYQAAITELETLKGKYPPDRHVQVTADLQMVRYMQSTDLTKAKQIIKEVSESEIVRLSPDLLHDLLVFQHSELGDPAWQDTAKQYIEAVSKSRDREQSEFAPIEIAYYFEHDVEKSAILAAEFIRKYPSNRLAAEAAFIRGKHLLSSGDKNGALTVFDALVATWRGVPNAPNYVDFALQQSAKILGDLGQTAEAIKRLQLTSATTPLDLASKLDSIGNMWMRAGRWDEAAKEFKREAETKWIAPDILYRAMYNLGDCYYRRGDTASARDCMSKIIAQAQDSSWASKARGMLYLWSVPDKIPVSEEAKPD